MARVSVEFVSNFQQSFTTTEDTAKGKPIYHPPKSNPGPRSVPAPGAVTLEEEPEAKPAKKYKEEKTSAGTSSSVFEKKQDKTGSSSQETEETHPKPAHSVESHSGKHPQQSPPSPSSARSTGGSTHGTGSDPRRR